MKYANFQNRLAFQYIFSNSGDEGILRPFLNSFLKEKLGITLQKINWTNSLPHDPFFRFKGCLRNQVLMEAESQNDTLVYIQLDVLFLHWGLTQVQVELTDEVDFHRSDQEKSVVFIHLAFDIGLSKLRKKKESWLRLKMNKTYIKTLRMHLGEPSYFFFQKMIL